MYKKSNQTLFNILYIEDDMLTKNLTSHLLQNLCTKLILAKDGLDGFIKFKTNVIDLIITDLSMPQISGSDFIKMVRDTNSEVPIIILSVYTQDEILHKIINYGIQGYIQKPINREMLEQQINNVKEKKLNVNFVEQYQKVANDSAIISKINTEGIITYVNEKFCNTSGYSKEELIGQNYNEIHAQKESSHFFTETLNKILKDKKIWTGILKHKTKDNELYYLKTTIQPIVNAHGWIEHFISLSIPITDIIHPEEQLNDYLTQHNESVILLIKIEEFKYLKRSFTTKITKKLQNIFAKELLKYMPHECGFQKVYLLNNGVFAFIKKHDNLVDKHKMSEVLLSFQKSVNKKKIKIGTVNYTLSIVSSLAYGKDALENAKIGLKKILKNKEEFIIASNFVDEVTRDSNQKLDKFIMLKEAIDSYRIVSHYQPIVNNQTLEVEKYESLVRLIDNENNIISPNNFLVIAKEGKYYQAITSIVLRNSFRALFHRDIEIAINLSALDMEDTRTQSEFFILLEKYKTETHRITIELVEDEKINNKEETQKFIKKIKKYGVKIALDDFGKGLSNFTRILSYEPDYIKIDGSLIRNIEHDTFSKDLVETIVFFAKKQNIKTIAEFVENENIYKILKELGVDYSQGHYFSKAALLKELIPSSL